jgi:pimeloyl-ACP methyl ester carboxylesterase
MDEIGFERPIVVGSSLGAYLAPFFALRHPGRVGALLLGNGFTDARDLAGHPLFDRVKIEATPSAAFHHEWSDRIASTPDSDLKTLQQHMLVRKPPEHLHAHFLAVVRAKACPALALPPASITVLHCDDDPVISLPVRERVVSQFPGAKSISMPKGGHYPHVLNAQAYQALLLDICSGD